MSMLLLCSKLVNGRGGGQKSSKSCLRSLRTAPRLASSYMSVNFPSLSCYYVHKKGKKSLLPTQDDFHRCFTISRGSFFKFLDQPLLSSTFFKKTDFIIDFLEMPTPSYILKPV